MCCWALGAAAVRQRGRLLEDYCARAHMSHQRGCVHVAHL
jgi:hypothetical protein